MARTKSPTSDSAATIGFEATALHDSASLKKQSHSAEPAAQPRSEQGEG
jgi:hypothetical protein